MAGKVIKTGRFAGLDANDAFVQAAQSQAVVIYRLPVIPWPAGLRPTSMQLGNYAPGATINSALEIPNVDALIVLYTEQETMAALDVLTGDPTWDPKTQGEWCLYAHNFAKFKKLIANPNANSTLASGAFGHLSAMKIAGKTVVLYKTELHPKQDGTKIPFVPVMQQLIGELAPDYVITTGTAGAIGSRINCGDVAICTNARFHVQDTYPAYPAINDSTQISDTAPFYPQYVQYAATHLTQLSLPGLKLCYQRLQTNDGYSFVHEPTLPAAIYVGGVNSVPGPDPMDIVSADYMTTDDNNNSEGLQSLGIMNDTDDAFLFFAISKMPAAKQPKFISVRNASEPQMVHSRFPDGTPQTTIIDILKNMAGTIFGIYEYCTTINSALACWGVVAGLK
jgi:hypothetical protein